MNDDERAQMFSDWLISLPDRACVRWGSPQVPPTFPFATGWADLVIPDFGGDEWVLEVYPTMDVIESAPTPMAVVAEYDSKIQRRVGEGGALATLIDPKGCKYHLKKKIFPDDLWPDAGISGDIAYCDLWSVEALAKALSKWILENTGRDDLTLVWDATAGHNKEEVERKLRAEGYFPVGNDLYISPAVIEALFNTSPDRAIRMLDIMKSMPPGEVNDIPEDQ